LDYYFQRGSQYQNFTSSRDPLPKDCDEKIKNGGFGIKKTFKEAVDGTFKRSSIETYRLNKHLLLEI
jgi:hypothetical protein